MTRIFTFRQVLLQSLCIWCVLSANIKALDAQSEEANSTDQAVPAGVTAAERPLGVGRPRLERWRDAALSANVPIDFYGKTVDQNGQPVAGADVQLRLANNVVQPNGHPIDAHFATNLLTDTNGLFQIHGENGTSVTVEGLSRGGFHPAKYELPKTFAYPASETLSNQVGEPILFVMYANQFKDSVLAKDFVFKISANHERYSVDLTTGKIAHGPEAHGDLSIWLKRSPDAQFGRRYFWSYGVSVADDGLLEERQKSYEDMVLAPTEGYVPSYSYSQEATTNTQGAGICFYLRCRSAKLFARVSIGVDPFSDRLGTNGSVRIRYTLNPTGARILR